MLGKILLLALGFCGVNGLAGCIGEDGKVVDFYYVLKGHNGNSSYYMKESDAVLTRTKNGMGAELGAVPMTLSQVYKTLPKSYAYAMYNDQTPAGKSSGTMAHAKGVVFFDGTQGFWLLHSLPKYPADRSTGYDGLSDERYGQSFHCLTLTTDQLDTIGAQLQVYRPLFYDSGMSADLEKQYPAFAAAISGTHNDEDSSVQEFETVGGATFTHFAKSAHCACELYEDLVAPQFEVGLSVETWMNGATANKIPTSCTDDGFKWDVQDISLVEMQDGETWKETMDHSKWAVSVDGKTSIVCVGGVNRQYSQSKRGGGTMCYTAKSTWKAFNSIVANITDPCSDR